MVEALLVFACPLCRHQFTQSARHAGKQGRCGSCRGLIVLGDELAEAAQAPTRFLDLDALALESLPRRSEAPVGDATEPGWPLRALEGLAEPRAQVMALKVRGVALTLARWVRRG